MQYRGDKYGNPISILGFGCMRFTKHAGRYDFDKAEQEILAAYHAGVNYYDTAYIYPGNEALIGEIFEKNHIRDKINIATKLPHYQIKSKESAEKCFCEQRKHLRTDYVDYYMMHMLTDVKTWERLKGIGIEEWIREKKEEGSVRQIGFSYHGNSDMFCRLLDIYDWDFCMIQYNYMDENTQAGKKGLQYAAAKGIPVIIMEPLRGGQLVRGLPDRALELFENYEIKRTPAQWALHWLWNQPEVTCVLSGMNSMEMVRANVMDACEAITDSFTDKDRTLLKEVVYAIKGKMKVGCTACGYCMPCPKHVDIPAAFAAYNKCYSDNKIRGLYEYMMCTALRKDSTGASNCVGCGLCEQHCPQDIRIRGELKAAEKVLEGPIYKIAKKILPIFMKY